MALCAHQIYEYLGARVAPRQPPWPEVSTMDIEPKINAKLSVGHGKTNCGMESANGDGFRAATVNLGREEWESRRAPNLAPPSFRSERGFPALWPRKLKHLVHPKRSYPLMPHERSLRQWLSLWRTSALSAFWPAGAIASKMTENVTPTCQGIDCHVVSVSGNTAVAVLLLRDGFIRSELAKDQSRIYYVITMSSLTSRPH